MDFYAHSLPGRPLQEWEPLLTHLNRVAELSAQFAAKWNAADWGRLVGLWHDIGKYSLEFQSYLRGKNGQEAHLEQVTRVDHSTAGAQLANRRVPQAGRILAYCIAGHHTGLADAFSSRGRSALEDRLQRVVPSYTAPPEILEPIPLCSPALTLGHRDGERAAFQLSLYCRMLFSALVDADFLATEEFMNPEQAAKRPERSIDLEPLVQVLAAHIHKIAAESIRNDVFDCRQLAIEACRSAAEKPPGLFSLTVPTGGGKTFASLEFALRHARLHGMTRVIYGIPFTTIIEQTANVFRGVFQPLGEGIVLEHHSNLDPTRETPKSRLASENWDAPIVVTTNVQFFESLFAAKTSRTRKLHRISKSVVVLDEAQTLPLDLLKPCLAVLRELACDYGCTIVLCTATQPAIVERPEFPIGLSGVREIIPEPLALYQRMRRVDVTDVGSLTDEALTERLAPLSQFLCIVNTRAHAARLFDMLSRQIGTGQGVFHLSTLMCAAHRTECLEAIRARLRANLPCRVVSTQLVESGVDVDFPVVYRALSGVDAIAQAAGRCNREGRQRLGSVFVFTPAEVRLNGMLGSMARSGSEILADAADPLELETVRRYFEFHYWKHSDRWDERQVMECFAGRLAFNFREAAERFRLIEDATRSVIVPWRAEGEDLVALLRRDEPDRNLRRRLQRFTVNIHEPAYIALLGGDCEEIRDGFAMLMNMHLYDDEVGLRIERTGQHEVESLIL